MSEQQDDPPFLADLVRRRAEGAAWKTLEGEFGYSRTWLYELHRQAVNKVNKVYMPSEHLAGCATATTTSSAIGLMEATCATCPFHALRRAYRGGKAVEAIECRYWPAPVDKEASDWCAQHPLRRAMAEAVDASRDAGAPELPAEHAGGVAP